MKLKRLLIILGILAVALFWAMGGIQNPKTYDGEITDFGGDEAEPDDSLVVMTWNIAYAYGEGSDGDESYQSRSREEMEERLRILGDQIKKVNPDLVLLQEVDFGSKRSGNIDQLKMLANITKLKYGAYAQNWRAGYVPYPYWPPARHFGKMNSGIGVLSRYPIKANKVTLHPKPEANIWIYNAFYSFRTSQHVEIQIGNSTFGIINNHLEAYKRENREKQAEALLAMVRELQNSSLAIVGGDMNTLPVNAEKKHDFPDDPGHDLREDRTMQALLQMDSFREVIDEEDYKKNEAAYFTFPSHDPNRRIDYIFVNEGIHVSNAYILQSGEISDHLPVVAELKLT